jgi:hypothetical protein
MKKIIKIHCIILLGFLHGCCSPIGDCPKFKESKILEKFFIQNKYNKL